MNCMYVDPPELDLQLHETNFKSTQCVQISECTEMCFILCCNTELVIRCIFFFCRTLVIFT
jgi:hypothetical protein